MAAINLKFLTALLLCLKISPMYSRGVNGGINCAACTVVTGLVEQLSYLKREALIKSVERLCGKLPSKYWVPCYEIAHTLEPLLLDKRFMELFTPDVFCYAAGSCYREERQTYCHLFPRPQNGFHNTVVQMKSLIEEARIRTAGVKLPINKDTSGISSHSVGIDFCGFPLVKEVCDVFLHTVQTLRPAEDVDNDGYSILSQARGIDWRGKDCDDLDPTIHPGAKPINYDRYRDSNCNGIYGIDPVSRTPWEQKLCPSNYRSKGLIYIGDSFGAHFHFPRTWMDPRLIDLVSPKEVSDAVMDELDWPQVSYATGFNNHLPPELSNVSSGFSNSLVDSIYQRMRARNLCNHRDYENLSQNGAAARDFSYIANVTIVRNKISDKPALVLYAFMGNDVCNRFHDTVGNMTPPTEFRENVLATLNILDKKLPTGSHVVLMGLLDGAFIYPEMADKVHPIGSVLGNVRYKNVYDWFSCMEIGPCNGWMTGNTTLRRITSEWSHSLNNVLKAIAANTSYSCCQLHYIDSPAGKAVEWWTKKGGLASDLIEPVDSVHPNQLAQSVIAQLLWEDIFENLPRDVVGPLNPSNKKIKKIFGDQGGH